MKSKLFTGAATAVLGAAALALPAMAQPTKERPKLTVVLVMDQFRHDYLTRYAANFGEGGFKWLQKRGANLTNARYSYATTYTGPGHALILSGAYGHTNGIVGNKWWNGAANRSETMFFDPDAALLGTEASYKEDDTSPRNFIGNNLGDELRLSNNFRSKVVAVSLKDRSAVMLAGKLGKAYWFHTGTGGFLSSTYYMKELPAWVQSFNSRRIPDSFYNKQWTKSLPEAAYTVSHRDDFPNEADLGGLGKTFPHKLTSASGKPDADYYEAFTATPYSIDYELEFAKRTIENEGLGTDDDPDILGVSITTTDITGHTFGPDSQEVQDVVAATDRALADFFSYLNRRFKTGELNIVFTADHGAAPMPEYMASLGFDAGRIRKKTLVDAITTALNERYGAPANGKWIVATEDPGITLNRAVVAEKKLDFAEVQKVAGESVLGIKGVAAYFTRAQFLSGQLPDTPLAHAFAKSFHPDRSGDLLVATRPFYFWGKYGESDEGSTHGSPFEYDTHVPMIFVGPRFASGTYNRNVDMTDLAPTLAAALNISAPAANEGTCIAEIIK